jgi:hypothetical protein
MKQKRGRRHDRRVVGGEKEVKEDYIRRKKMIS